jgi:hypothetical protein
MFDQLHNSVLPGGVATPDTLWRFYRTVVRAAWSAVMQYDVVRSTASSSGIKNVYLARKFGGLENTVSMLAPSRIKLQN